MKRVLVTGSSRGLGRAVADALAAEGYTVVTHSAKSGGTDLVFDVSDRAAAKAALEADIAANGPYYAVVLNAGVCRDRAFAEMEGDEWDDVVRTDLDGFYNVVKPCVMPMVMGRIRGRIVAISSASGVTGNRGQVNYAAAKAGLFGAVKSLAVELAARGITVNAIAPGFMDVGMSAAMPPEAAESARKSIPMQRFGRPVEIASLVSYLLSDGAAYLTRQVISVNGGMY